MSKHNEKIRIIDVSPRDGLQNESSIVSTKAKIRLIRNLVEAGVQEIEVGSFVSPKWVPKMADTAEIVAAVKDLPNLQSIVFVPNMKGLESAMRLGVKKVAVFPAATESFSKKNLNASMAESFSRIAEVTKHALANGIAVRGYTSVAFHCPFEGWVVPAAAIELTEKLLDIGCYEVSLADTTGRASPGHIAKVVEPLIQKHGPEKLVGHFHDTYNQGIANALWAWHLGLRAFDASTAGLGGCPYSPGATGNIATEALAHMFEGMGIATGIDQDKLLYAAGEIASHIDRPLHNAFLRK